MPPRAYVLIFFFWVLLTIITPTLIYWSSCTKPYLGSQGEKIVDTRSRRVMSSMENNNKLKITTTLNTTSSTPSRSPSPAPSPSPMRWNDTMRIKHNGELRTKSLTYLAAIWWVVWTERNNIIFRDTRLNAARAFERVTYLIKDWADAL
ncbi:uncharacterized protein LOC109716762 [Ananas comosus]|uniref:Uncharacterized protein LOC109716762 n=1 Tax=Ananas comosus TaxID=4615 RepID=A0A6P5FNL9_ANACO|nr:uncharacterized protein LOC109716762 [Ananas comosus]